MYTPLDHIYQLSLTLQKNRNKGNDVSIHENMRVMNQEALDSLLNNLDQFVNALRSESTKAHLNPSNSIT